MNTNYRSVNFEEPVKEQELEGIYETPSYYILDEADKEFWEKNFSEFDELLSKPEIGLDEGEDLPDIMIY